MEMRIMGNITIKQFAFLLVLFLLSVAIYKWYDQRLGLLIGIGGFLLYLILTGKKVGGQPLLSVLPKAFGFLFSPRFYVWRGGKSGAIKEIKIEEKKEIPLQKGTSSLAKKKFLTEIGKKS
ncbi:hypothetical protein H5T58_01165 [Candidatus Parcubacteria bacterium]|nr:hypothetical protein [Candidatus Parcubacteria bacterium]